MTLTKYKWKLAYNFWLKVCNLGLNLSNNYIPNLDLICLSQNWAMPARVQYSSNSNSVNQKSKKVLKGLAKDYPKNQGESKTENSIKSIANILQRSSNLRITNGHQDQW